MTDKRILLLSGARALHISHGGSLQSEAWAKGILRRALFTEPAPTFVVHGNAVGPDTWADLMTHEPGSYTRALAFALSGVIYLGRQDYKRWRPVGGGVDPLARDRAMVAHCVKARDDGWHVDGLALFAPWSKTRGTAYTVKVAKKARIHVVEETCPMAMAGGNG